MAPDAVIAALKSGLRGALIQPSDANYNDARKIYNAIHDKKPRLIAEVADVADVIAWVNFARNEKMIVAIQGGGHNAGGLGTVDDGLVIKLSRMKSTRVDPDARTVRVDGGLYVGRCRSCDARVRPRRADGHHLDDRRRRSHARRRARSPYARVRSHDRQPARSGRRAG